jgi:hypothetical protein
MHHKATIKLGSHDHLGYNIQCSCGTGGDFGSKDEAMNWMTVNHFRYLQGVNTAEFVDATPQPVASEAESKEQAKPKAKSAR